MIKYGKCGGSNDIYLVEVIDFDAIIAYLPWKDIFLGSV